MTERCRLHVGRLAVMTVILELLTPEVEASLKRQNLLEKGRVTANEILPGRSQATPRAFPHIDPAGRHRPKAVSGTLFVHSVSAVFFDQ